MARIGGTGDQISGVVDGMHGAQLQREQERILGCMLTKIEWFSMGDWDWGIVLLNYGCQLGPQV
jgi:hypothetical protein